jgi:hypothetical protein
VTVGNSVNKRSNEGRAVDELLQILDVLEVTGQDVLEYILLTLVAADAERESDPVSKGGQEPCIEMLATEPTSRGTSSRAGVPSTAGRWSHQLCSISPKGK